MVEAERRPVCTSRIAGTEKKTRRRRTLGCVLAKRDLSSHGESPESVERIRGLAVCGVALRCREFTVGIHLCRGAACGRGQPSVRHRLW
jgi:hypothetical protein